MVLQDESDNYIYIHRLLYDSAVILADKYDSIEALAKDIAPTGDIPSDRKDVQFFYDHTPAPVNILAPYLLLCPEAFTSLYDMAGALHVMSNTFDFKKLPQIPKEVRLNAMTFSMRITEEYKLSWELFLSKCIPYSDDLFLNKSSANTISAPVQTAPKEQASATTTSSKGIPENTLLPPADPNAPASEGDEDTTYLTLPDGSRVLFDVDFDELLSGISDSDEEEEEEQETEEVKVPEPPTSTPVEQPKTAKPTGLDFLKTVK